MKNQTAWWGERLTLNCEDLSSHPDFGKHPDLKARICRVSKRLQHFSDKVFHVVVCRNSAKFKEVDRAACLCSKSRETIETDNKKTRHADRQTELTQQPANQ